MANPALKRKVSIIIPTWNRNVEVQKLLVSLESQSFRDYEIFVIDDGSEIPFYCNAPKVKTFRTEHKGVVNARNYGLKMAKGNYIWFLDSDVQLVSENILQDMADYLDKNPDVGSIGCEGIKGIPIYRENSINMEVKTKILKQRHKEVTGITACNLMVRKEIMEKTNGFATCYFWGAEEKELAFKIKKMGYKQIVSLDFYVEHFLSPAGSVRTFDNLIQSRMLYLKRNERLKYLFIPFLDMLTIFSKFKYLLGLHDTFTNAMVSRYEGSYPISLLKAYWGVYFDRK